jgi:hypothetical protein
MRNVSSFALLWIALAVVVAPCAASSAADTTAHGVSTSRDLPTPLHVPGLGQHCRVELRYYDAGSLSYFLLQHGWIGDCVSPIDGVTYTPNLSLPGRFDVDGFPDGFAGPATVLTCDIDYFDDECPPWTLDQLEKDFGIVRALDGDGVSMERITICPVRFECNEYCELDPPGPYLAGTCGDPNGDDAVTATDALATLQVAIGMGECLPEQCDADGDLAIDASDALRILVAAVGQSGLLQCPPPCAADTPSQS